MNFRLRGARHRQEQRARSDVQRDQCTAQLPVFRLDLAGDDLGYKRLVHRRHVECFPLQRRAKRPRFGRRTEQPLAFLERVPRR